MDAYILIVENELDIADVIRRYLEFEGFSTACAVSCMMARATFATRLPDLIVLDWHLPDLDGDRWIAELRADPATFEIPIVLITGGYPTQALIAQMHHAQVPILIKPFSLDMLSDLIAQMLPRQQAVGAAEVSYALVPPRAGR